MTTLEEVAKHWEGLAAADERWAAFLRSGKATHLLLPEDPARNDRAAKAYRNVALSLRMTAETGQTHCSCTTPPHVLIAGRQISP